MLSNKQIEALDLLMGAEDITQREVAKRIGVTEVSISRWMNNDKEFRRELGKARRKFLHTAINRNVKLVSDVLKSLHADATEGLTSKDRTGAADKFLSHLMHIMDTTDAAEDLAEMQCDASNDPPTDPATGEGATEETASPDDGSDRPTA